MEQPIKKAPPSWTMRYQARPDFLNLARFSDPVDAAALSTANMYFQTEELRADEENENETSEDFLARKRRRQRSFYRRKQTVQLDYEKEGEKVYFEGKGVNLELNNEDIASHSKPSSEFKYVMLQFVKVEGSANPEIHVLPVGDMFAFRKTGQPGDILWSEIADKYSEEEEKTKAMLSRYNKISEPLSKYEKKKELLDKATSGGAGGDSFSLALSKAFGKKSSGPLAEGGGGGRVEIDEGGVDQGEVEREFDFVGGDYGGRFVDDEEDHVRGEEEEAVRGAEREMSDSWRYDELGEEEDGDNSEEEEVEEGKKPQEDEDGGIRGEGTMVTGEMLLSASQAIKKIQKQMKRGREEGGAPAGAGGEEREGEEKGGRGEKRVRFGEAGDEAGEGEKSKAVGPSSMPPPPSLPASSPSSAPSAALSYSLSEAGVKSYLVNRGGKVSAKELNEMFKPILKAYAKQVGNKLAGIDRLLDILGSVASQIDDPLLGKAFVLKSNSGTS